MGVLAGAGYLLMFGYFPGADIRDEIKTQCSLRNYFYCFNVAQDRFGSETEAVSFFRQGCDVGDMFGCSILGGLYLNGYGVDEDVDRATFRTKVAPCA